MGSGSSPLGGILFLFFKMVKNNKQFKNLINLKSLLKLNLHFGGKLNKISYKHWPEIKGTYKKIAIINLQKIILNMQIVDELFRKIILQGGSVLFFSPSKNIYKNFDLVKKFSTDCSENFFQEPWKGGIITNRFKVNLHVSKKKKKLQPYLNKFNYDALFLLGLKNSYTSALLEFQKIICGPVIGLINNTGEIKNIDYLLTALSKKNNNNLYINYFFLSFISKLILFNKIYNVDVNYLNNYYNYYTTLNWFKKQQLYNKNLLNQFYFENFKTCKGVKINKLSNKYLNYTSLLTKSFYNPLNIKKNIYCNSIFEKLKDQQNLNYLFLNKLLKKKKISLVFNKNYKIKNFIVNLYKELFFPQENNSKHVTVQKIQYLDKSIYYFFFFRLIYILKNLLFLKDFNINSNPIKIQDRFKDFDVLFKKNTPLTFVQLLKKRLDKNFFNIYYYLNTYQYYTKKYLKFQYKINTLQFFKSQMPQKTNKNRILLYNKYFNKNIRIKKFINIKRKIKNNKIINIKNHVTKLHFYNQIFNTLNCVSNYYRNLKKKKYIKNLNKNVYSKSISLKFVPNKNLTYWKLYKQQKYLLSQIHIIPFKFNQRDSHFYSLKKIIGISSTVKKNLNIQLYINKKNLRRVHYKDTYNSFLNKKSNILRKRYKKIFRKRPLIRKSHIVLNYIYYVIYQMVKNNKIKSFDIPLLKLKYNLKNNNTNNKHLKFFNIINLFLNYNLIFLKKNNQYNNYKNFTKYLFKKTFLTSATNTTLFSTKIKYFQKFNNFKKINILFKYLNIQVNNNFKINKQLNIKKNNFNKKKLNFYIKFCYKKKVKQKNYLKNFTTLLYNIFYFYNSLNNKSYQLKLKNNVRKKSIITLIFNYKIKFLKSNFGYLTQGKIPIILKKQKFNPLIKKVYKRLLKKNKNIYLKQKYNKNFLVRYYFAGLQRRGNLMHKVRRKKRGIIRGKVFLPYSEFIYTRFKQIHRLRVDYTNKTNYLSQIRNKFLACKNLYYYLQSHYSKNCFNFSQTQEYKKSLKFRLNMQNRTLRFKFAEEWLQNSSKNLKPFLREYPTFERILMDRQRSWDQKAHIYMYKKKDAQYYKSKYLNISYKYNKFVSRYLYVINNIKYNKVKYQYQKNLKNIRAISKRQLVSTFILNLYNINKDIVRYINGGRYKNNLLNYYNSNNLKNVFYKFNCINNKILFKQFFIFYCVSILLKTYVLYKKQKFLRLYIFFYVLHKLKNNDKKKI